jgi:hypothetical protein
MNCWRLGCSVPILIGMTKAGLFTSTALASAEQRLLPAEAGAPRSRLAALDEELQRSLSLMSTRAASEYLLRRWGLRRSARTLQGLRRTGRGPRFRSCGNDVMYTPSALDEWVQERFAMEVRSTSELSERRRLANAEAGSEHAVTHDTQHPNLRTGYCP